MVPGAPTKEDESQSLNSEGLRSARHRAELTLARQGDPWEVSEDPQAQGASRSHQQPVP